VSAEWGFCILPAVCAAPKQAEEPDQHKLPAAIEPLKCPADGRPGSADGVPKFANEQLSGREQDAAPIGLKSPCDLRGRIETGLMGQSETGLMCLSENGLMGQSDNDLSGQSDRSVLIGVFTAN